MTNRKQYELKELLSLAMLNVSISKNINDVQLITWTSQKSYNAKRKKRMIHEREGNFYSLKLRKLVKFQQFCQKSIRLIAQNWSSTSY